MQQVDFTTLTAACGELRAQVLPARLEQVYQRDRHTVNLALRTLTGRCWLALSWHPQGARLCLCDPPPRTPDTFTFSDQLRHQLGGLALVAIEPVQPWERAFDLQFARRPGEPIVWHLYAEIMGKRSNAILANQDNIIITCAHQVSEKQSSVRPVQTGQPYELPPALTDPAPSLAESYERWQERVSLIPGKVGKRLLSSYRGLSSALVNSMVVAAGIDPETSTLELTEAQWQGLFQEWLRWLQALAALGQGDLSHIKPAWRDGGYTVLYGGDSGNQAISVQELLDRYYSAKLNHEEFQQLRQALMQKLSRLLGKLRQKAAGWTERLQESEGADRHRLLADLLMAHLYMWEPGMKSIQLPDFETGDPVTVPLNPEKNAVQNAQSLYKLHQKLKRARTAIEPLLAEVVTEIHYLEQVEVAVTQIDTYREEADLLALQEIRQELMQEGQVDSGGSKPGGLKPNSEADFHRYQSPSGFELLVGRNNRQNDLLSFRIAGDYDLWFHTQEIAGSHVLLRLNPGAVADDRDLQLAADLTAYYSRARQSEQVPVVYTKPKHVYKPKGAKPGMVVYKHERVIWGRPQVASVYLSQS
ncbi:MAG TPA: NFACT family protein [Oscillatoriaceae cyanobacterium M33_DOE_052]|uniref:Rqc2 homolog RqcH n=1 Tax=Planktothricoides sp. SpSt-374 TaxID=2282167 RepID=A0A7C3VUB6_9CYAN|nr:NFACT family protein [Oscillatoriaceae cyanobacterium M33_DOE_052]